MAGEARNLTDSKVRVRIDNVRKVFNTRNGEMVALNGVSLDIHDNEFICVVGRPAAANPPCSTSSQV